MRILAALCLLLAACGGGGGTPAASTALPAKLRTDAQFCYFAMNGLAANEASDHASCVWAADFYGPIEQLAALSYAKASGAKIILSLPACRPGLPLAQIEPEMRFYLQRIADAGLLQNIFAITPCDEPDDQGISDADMKAIITAVHAAMASFDATRAKPITMFYTCGGKTRPGIEYVELPGCDRYDHGCAVFAEAYGEFEALAAKEPDIHPWAIAGGADPWHEQPACWEAKVHSDARYAGLIVFLYQTVTDRGSTYTGVRDNGMRKVWCDVGMRFRTGNPAAKCG